MSNRLVAAVFLVITGNMVAGFVPATGQEVFHSLRTPNFELKYQPGIPEGDARKVAEYLEQDYTYLSKVLHMNLEAQMEVRIYDSELKYAKGSGDKKSSRGVSLKRGVLHVKPVAKLETENRFAQGLSMELSMALLDRAIRLGCPQWLAQSFAVYHAGLMPDLSPPTGKKLRYFSDLDEDIQEYPDPPRRQEVEFLLGSTMKFFLETFGEDKAPMVFGKFNGTTPIEEVFQSAFGKEFGPIEEAWTQYMIAAVGTLPSRNSRGE